MISKNVHSQTLSEASADKDYNQYAYVDAIKTYERIFSKGYVSQDILQKLGDSYYFKADLENSAKWYGELFKFTKDLTPEYYFRYAQSLKAIKDYKKADEMMARFSEMSGGEQRAKLVKDQKDYLAQIKKNSGHYTIKNGGIINSKYSDYGGAFYKNKLIFVSARDTSGSKGKKSSWTGEGYTNLYGADIGIDGVMSDPERFGDDLNTIYHESTSVFTKDGKTIYFTRNNYIDGKKKKDKSGSILVKIYRAAFDGSKWGNVTELPFNSNEYSTAHPALSLDEKELYFSSNMPGTLGQSDLFKVTINSDGSFGKPTNLGNTINTEGRETFPTISSDNNLYFASDGHPGLGGLDVFVSKIEKDGSFTKVQNVGEPVNSSFDDFAFLIDDKTKLGYVTSNRDGGYGGDDIYLLEEITKKLCNQSLAVIVTDKETGLPIEGAKVTLYDANYKMLQEAISDKDGKFDFGTVPCGSRLYLKTEKEEYFTQETPTVIPGRSGKTVVDVQLEKQIKKVKVDDDLAKTFGIKIIYFDLNKSNIRPDAAVELAKILDVLEQYPTMELKIGSHTDSRQTAQYNQVLSDRRANSTMKWLISKGVNPKRLTAKGYGKSKLVNNCADGVQCTEDQHQENRRSEFVISKL